MPNEPQSKERPSHKQFRNSRTTVHPRQLPIIGASAPSMRPQFISQVVFDCAPYQVTDATSDLCLTSDSASDRLPRAMNFSLVRRTILSSETTTTVFRRGSGLVCYTPEYPVVLVGKA